MAVLPSAHVVVCTDRGTFYQGELIARDAKGLCILEGAMQAVPSEDTENGWMLLAIHGPPLIGWHISGRVPQLTTTGVISIAWCTERAMQGWREER